MEDKADKVDVTDKGKSKVVEETPRGVEKDLLVKDAEEFMRLIKKSDYKIVDHLHQTPSKISILNLLLC